MVWLFKIFFWEDLTAYIDIESSEEFLSRIGLGRSDLASGYYYSGPTKPIFFPLFFFLLRGISARKCRCCCCCRVTLAARGRKGG